MKHITHMWRCNILFLIILGGCCHAWGQVAFVASPSALKIGIKDRVQVDFTISNVPDLQEVSANGFGDFIPVQGPMGTKSVSIINGVQTISFKVSYVLQPKREGKLTMPGAIAKDGSNHSYQSNPVTIEVVAGSVMPQQSRRQQMQNIFGDDEDPFAAMQQQLQRIQQMQQAQMQRMQQMQQRQQGGMQQQQAQNDPPVNEAEIKKDLFIKVTVDKSKVHVGEQITTSYKLYSRIPMQAGITKLPSLDGFWTQDFEIPPQPKPQEEIIDGKKYQVFLLKKSALFPQQVGTLELDPAEAKGMARIVQQVRRRVGDMVDPFTGGTLMMNDPIFNNAYYNTMAYRDVRVELKSTPVKITVIPLPEKGKPEDYGGAVGKFTISGKIDKKELTTDDVATYTLNITGSGNFKLISAPKLVLPNGINTYDPVVVDTITSRNTTISGSKILTYAVTPQTPGDYEIPALPFTYFDAESGTYTTLQTEPIKIHVAPGKHYNPAKSGDNNTIALKDIHDNAKGNINDLRIMGKPLAHAPGYWSLYAFPILAFVGLLVWRKKNDDGGDTGLIRHKKANKIALQRLATAKVLLQKNDKVKFYEEISKAIWLYLSDKLRIPLSSLSRETATAALVQRNVPQQVLQQYEAVIEECATALYATGGANQMAHTYDAAVKVISDFEATL